MEISKVKGNTYYIDTGMTYIPFYKINETEIILLDCGWIKEREEIVYILEKNNLKVKGILCTHAHIDHIGNAAYFKEKCAAKIAMPTYEALMCSSEINIKVYYNNQSIDDVKKHYGHMVCKTDINIDDKYTNLEFCDVCFEIIHTPGHSPAHICVVTPDEVAYLGDSLISYDVMNSSKMPYAFILKEDLKSKEKLYSLNCSYYIIAHKGIYDCNNITELIDDNIKFYKNRAKTICDVINKPMTMEEIFKQVLNKFNITVKSRAKYSTLYRMLRFYIEYLYDCNYIDAVMNDGFIKYVKC